MGNLTRIFAANDREKRDAQTSVCRQRGRRKRRQRDGTARHGRHTACEAHTVLERRWRQAAAAAAAVLTTATSPKAVTRVKCHARVPLRPSGSRARAQTELDTRPPPTAAHAHRRRTKNFVASHVINTL